MTTIACPQCNKFDKVHPSEHPSDKENVYFKCENCGAMFDDKSNLAKFAGGVVGGIATVGAAIWAIVELVSGS
jgi:hypothetical protein